MSNDQNSTRTMDDAQPTSDKAPAPIALLVIFAALVYWGMLYLDDHGGGFDPVVYMPYANFADVNDHQIVLDPSVIAKREGEKIFNANCAVCHGAAGVNGTCPPLAGSDWVNAAGPDRIARLVLNGGSGPITVSGKLITPPGQMLSFKDAPGMDDQKIAWVLTYVRSSFGNNASMVTKEEIAKIRAEVASRRTPWTAPELLNVEFKVQVAEKKP
ncbi:MAG TPA: c-type cytochrome [Verrucomicrobiae bacterium]|nr:c-type cytochrome [Verrucomicrobiae bacterium]